MMPGALRTAFLFFIVFIQSIWSSECIKRTCPLGGRKIIQIYWNHTDGFSKNELKDDMAAKMRGSCVYKTNLCKQLYLHQFDVSVVVVNDEILAQELARDGLTSFSYSVHGDSVQQVKALGLFLASLCDKNKYAIIHCHSRKEIDAARIVAKRHQVKIVQTVHVESKHGFNGIKYADGVLLVSPHSVEKIDEIDVAVNKNSPIQWTAPFFDEQKFLSFIPCKNKIDFFKEEFGVTLDQSYPIVCSVANFYPQFKNHGVLLRAFRALIHEKGRKAYLVFAGSGLRMQEMQKLSRKFNLESYVYFLGSTAKTPELYYYSDINALTSDSESFGIVLLEGALMKKPLIGTAGTGMEAVVKDGSTGFLFKRNDANDLAEKLDILLSNEELRKQLGINAYEFVRSNFSADSCIQKLEDFYRAVLSKKVL